MAHPTQMEFVARVKSAFPDRFTSRRVLEIGSLDINGSARSCFEGCDYIGIDVAPGFGVDRVCQGQDQDAPDESFDPVISFEVMEHNPHWAETVRNMAPPAPAQAPPRSPSSSAGTTTGTSPLPTSGGRA